MRDRELLELAAKAAGMKGWQWAESWGSMAEKRLKGGFYFDRYWNPLEDDGDALRLAVDLHMLLDCCSLMARTTDDSIPWQEPTGGTDKNALMRRAIVMAAAEIGRNMP